MHSGHLVHKSKIFEWPIENVMQSFRFSEVSHIECSIYVRFLPLNRM